MSVPADSAVVLLLLGLALLLLSPADSCMETAWSNGWLDAKERLQMVTLSEGSAGSCTCCALCHRQPGCASLSFNSQTAECQLYSSVASYATLQPDHTRAWAYFMMPGRSEHEQFCRQDSDCQTVEDACRGRVCTNRSAVTCRVIADMSGARNAFRRADIRMVGWIGGQQIALECDPHGNLSGFTELLSTRRGTPITSGDLLELNPQLDPDVSGHSILSQRDAIRQLRQETTYHINVAIDSVWQLSEQQSRVPRDESLVIKEEQNVAQISFRNEQDVLVRVTIPTVSAASDAEPEYSTRLEYGDVISDKAYEVVEIYIRE